MRKAFVTAFVLCVVLASVSTASAVTLIRVNIPFAFHAGEVVLPAGEYTFEMDANLVVRGADMADSYFVPVNNRISRPLSGGNNLTFTKYDNTYFLSKILINGTEIIAAKTRLEKRMAQNASKPATVAQVREK